MKKVFLQKKKKGREAFSNIVAYILILTLLKAQGYTLKNMQSALFLGQIPHNAIYICLIYIHN